MQSPSAEFDTPGHLSSGTSPRIRVWAVVGRPSSGKSTIIGHLTSLYGAGNNGLDPHAGGEGADRFHSVSLPGGGHMSVYCLRRSWQEADMQPVDVVATVKKAADELANQKPPIVLSYFNVLMALEMDAYPDPQHGPFGKAHEYLSYFARVGWSIEKLVLLSPEAKHQHYERFGAPVLCLYNKDRDPDLLPRPEGRAKEIGRSLAAVRSHFGWS
ncbi:hypothetical protein ACFSM5_10505 [Lacibacterium aquatile]|uniref:G domain-containing protein n=1 Tax=Lacibacterium aquatile TaxID=1168082 RepID=A0ABW5DSD8_9PROT